MADTFDIAFDMGGSDKKEGEFEIDLCDDFLATDNTAVSEDVDIPDNYVPPVYSTEGTVVQPPQVTTVPTMNTEESEQVTEPDFEFDCPDPSAFPKMQQSNNDEEDDDDFGFDENAFQQTTISSSSTTTSSSSSSSTTTTSTTRQMMYSSTTTTTTTQSNTEQDFMTRAENSMTTRTERVESSMSTTTENSTGILDDLDVRLSFKEVAEKNNEEEEEDLNDLLLGLTSSKPKQEADDFEFDSPVHKSAANEKRNENLNDEFEIEISKSPEKTAATEAPARAHVEAPAKAAIIVPQDDSLKPQKDPTTVLRANGLLPQETSTADDDQNASLQAAQDEWATVQEVVPEIGVPDSLSTKKHDSSPMITYHEALDHLLSSDLNQYKGNIQISVPRRGFSALKHAIFGPPKLHKDLHGARDQAFCLAMCQLNNDDPVHIRILQTVYRKLTGSKFDCARFGGHWEQIGFQGNDPATDLRGCGILGLLQLLYLVATPKTARLARDIYKLSTHDVQNFPFCIMGINMTRTVIQSLREELLNKDLNKRRDVFDLLNDYYVSVFYHLYHIWKTQHKTIADTGFVIKDVEAFAKKKPQQILQNLDHFLEQQRSSGGGEGQTSEQPLKFTDFDE